MGLSLPNLPPPEVAHPPHRGAVVRVRQPPADWFAARPAADPPFTLSRSQRTAAVVALCAASFVFWDAAVLLPLRLLVVTFHELGHAATALLTGGEVVALAVGIDESGYTLTRGGSRLLILNGGYLGSILTGLGLLLWARRPAGARGGAGMLGAVLAAVAVWFYGTDPVGLATILVSAVVLLGLATRSPGWLVEVCVRCLGWFSLLYALVDIREDVFASGGVDVLSDAAILESMTGIAAPVWGLSWGAIGVGLLWAYRRRLAS